MNKQTLYRVAGAAVGTLSAILITDFICRKKHEKSASTGLLLAGLAGVAIGAALAYEPVRKAKKELTVSDMLDDHDVKLINQNISEVLSEEEAE